MTLTATLKSCVAEAPKSIEPPVSRMIILVLDKSLAMANHLCKLQTQALNIGYDVDNTGLYDEFVTVSYSNDLTEHKFNEITDYQKYITGLRSGGHADFPKLFSRL